jgi:hypothetical protein
MSNIDINGLIKKTVKKTVRKTLKEINNTNTNAPQVPKRSKQQKGKKTPAQKAQEDRHRKAMAEAKKLKLEGKAWNECLKIAWDNIKKSELNLDNISDQNGNSSCTISEKQVDIKQGENMAV